MNENNLEQPPTFIKRVATDDGVQRAAAGVLVAFIVAVAKEAIFAKA